ncbi:MAG: rhodanese-like domain-containing protein [Bacteroidota bacterium]|nr:rhodanese-like domain-containing protein [Candidatus Kapabacteria bacterium]MDW8219832.1 rhodanese-like domain-containing protein [Bacteroidota bacterium]
MKTLHIAFVALAISILLSCMQNDTRYTTLSAQEAKDFLEQHPETFVLDVRTLEEFATGHLPNATLLPVQELEQNIAQLPSDKNCSILVYCRSGSRSRTASAILAAHGFSRVINMQGGIIAWSAARFPIVVPSFPK